MQILRAQDYRRMPWKNGAGETTEIAVFPAGADISAFDWRISMATVSEDGLFSIFPGIDRTLSILDGEGMALDIDGKHKAMLTRDSAPLAFAADMPVEARLTAGPILDLNVMTRRGRFSHTVERHDIDADLQITPRQETCIVLPLGPATAVYHGKQYALSARDSIVLNDAATLRVAEQTGVFLIRIKQ
ncbi:HutD family protein [Rhizobium sp. CFBP 8762]|uniref:HutD/Ves family protein n=1 Tax=Rhizobium sp. CFBP 8762 TaxID=2775279 RepID=UPI00178306FF|nr:HutD family protein [Rhizobium sp. CFBP 8762]MBD8553712.1 HutD family protein [Rhizobium sp. CFBP 8762]